MTDNKKTYAKVGLVLISSCQKSGVNVYFLCPIMPKAENL